MSAPILLLGNQNSGKTTLFNALTGLHAKVANYPGVTVEARIGEINRISGKKVRVVDLPGTYSLIPASEEEELTVKALLGELAGLREHSLVVVVVDCTELRRGLYLYSQVIELGFKAIIALSLVDQRSEQWKNQVVSLLTQRLGTIIVPVSMNDKASTQKLAKIIDGVLAGSLCPHVKKQPLLFESLSESLKQKLSVEGEDNFMLPPHAHQSTDLIRNHNLFLYGLMKRGRLNRTMHHLAHLQLTDNDIAVLDQHFGEIPESRFKRVDEWLKNIKGEKDLGRAKSDVLDNVLLHPVFGTIFVVVLFVAMLQALFLLAQPLADVMGDGVSFLGGLLANVLPEQSLVRSLVTDGIVEGIGSILSFLPLIGLLFLFLAVLEDSGYLARATFLLDATLKRTGLCGRSLMPMLSGFACAVPAIMAARTIGNRKERLITIMVTPFLTCSARLPVFGLIVGALFSAYPPVFGFVHVGALIFLSMYLLGIVASIVAAKVLSKILKSDADQNLAIELPPYRFPNPFSVFKRVYDRVFLFIRDVGSIILASTIIVWALFHFEPGSIGKADPQGAIAPHAPVDLSHTYAGAIGKSIEPLVKPLGLDWEVGVGILASFLAREVFVSTMAVVYGLSTTSEEDVSLKAAFKARISPLSGFCLLIFFTLSMQCISTMAMTRRETGSLFWPMVQFGIMTGSGYFLAVMVYMFGNAMGWA